MNMDFAIPAAISQELNRFRDFVRTQLMPDLPSWTPKQKIPARFFQLMGEGTQDIQKLIIFRELMKNHPAT